MKTLSFTVKGKRNSYHLIPYVGNKSGFAHIFDSLIPESARERKIIDVFGGSGAFSIYCSYRFGSNKVTYNDNNPTIVNLLTWVKNNPKGLLNQYTKHREKSSSQYYLDIRDKSLDDGLVGAGRFLYLAKNAFSGKIRFNSSNKFNVPMRKGNKCPNIKPDHLAMISRAIRNITITNMEYTHYHDMRNAFMYLDPPYLENTNSHYNRVPDTGDFIKFVQNIKKQNHVMISEQNEPEFLKIANDFSVYRILLSHSLQYNTKNNSREIIAINYTPP